MASTTGLARYLQSGRHLLTSCSDAPDANVRVSKMSQGQLTTCQQGKTHDLCRHALAKSICAATCGLCDAPPEPASVQLRKALSSAAFGLALNFQDLEGFRPNDVYIRSNETFNGKQTWRGVDTKYWMYFCGDSTWAFSTARKDAWATCAGYLQVNERTGKAALHGIEVYKPVDLDFITDGLEGCEQAVWPLEKSSATSFCGPSSSRCSGTAVACWLSRFYQEEAVFAPQQQAVHLEASGTSYIAWSASSGEANNDHLYTVVQLALTQGCSVSHESSLLTGQIGVIQDAKNCSVDAILDRSSSLVQSSSGLLLGSIQPRAKGGRLSPYSTPVWFVDPVTAEALRSGTQIRLTKLTIPEAVVLPHGNSEAWAGPKKNLSNASQQIQ